VPVKWDATRGHTIGKSMIGLEWGGAHIAMQCAGLTCCGEIT